MKVVAHQWSFKIRPIASFIIRFQKIPPADLFIIFYGEISPSQNHIDVFFHPCTTKMSPLSFFVSKFDISTKLQYSWRPAAVVVDHLMFQETEDFLSMQRLSIGYRVRFCQAFLHPFLGPQNCLQIRPLRLPGNSRILDFGDGGNHAVFPRFYVMFPLILHQNLPKNLRKIPNIEEEPWHWRGSPALKVWVDSKFQTVSDSSHHWNPVVFFQLGGINQNNIPWIPTTQFFVITAEHQPRRACVFFRVLLKPMHCKNPRSFLGDRSDYLPKNNMSFRGRIQEWHETRSSTN